jgi:type IV pilus assembly protein PilC
VSGGGIDIGIGRIGGTGLPTYAYKALSLSGAMQHGREVAASMPELRASLASRDLILKTARQSDAAFSLMRSRTPLRQIAGFNRQFAVLLKAGIQIPEALALLASRPDQPRLEAAIRLMIEDIRRGTALSAAAAKLPLVFEPAHCATMTIGEQSGTLAASLEQYQTSIELRLRLAAQISKALTYPLILLATLSAVLVFLFVAVIPNFVAMYRDLGSDLPGATQALVFLAANFPLIAGLIVTTAIIAAGADRVWAMTPRGMRQRHRFLLKLPVFGGLRRASAAAAASRMLAVLTAAGTPLAAALDVAGQSLSDRHFAAVLKDVHGAIISGDTLSAALARHDLFPPASLKMLEAGEASGSLDRMLAEIASFHDGELERTLTQLTKLIEPALTLLSGLIVGGVIVAMYLPVFSLMDAVR